MTRRDAIFVIAMLAIVSRHSDEESEDVPP